ncbi:hypothetical protein TNCV_2573931 [Trichonephila clavipes]|nr:hypothetical protein TNCV_2573931 [Trichonephila clavipes]
MSSDSGPDPRTKNFTSKEFYHVTSKEVPRNDRLGEVFEVKKLTPLSQDGRRRREETEEERERVEDGRERGEREEEKKNEERTEKERGRVGDGKREEKESRRERE